MFYVFLVGYFICHELIIGGRLAGIVLILGGSTMYTFARDKEMRASEAATIIPVTQQDVVREERIDAVIAEEESAEQAVDEKKTAHIADK